MVADPQFLADAAQMKLELNITSGSELEALVDDGYKMLSAVVKKAAEELKLAGGN